MGRTGALAGALLCVGGLGLLAAPAPPGDGPVLLATDLTTAFYAGRDDAALWLDEDGAFAHDAWQAVLALLAVSGDGLEPDWYGTSRLVLALHPLSSDGLRMILEPDAAHRLDLQLTDALLAAGRDLAQGRVAPRAVDNDWELARPQPNWPELLPHLRERRASAFLDACRPLLPQYRGLRAALVTARQLSRPGQAALVLPGDDPWEPNACGAFTLELRARLALEGEALPAAPCPDEYDDDMVAAVERFQERHGIEPDGRVGKRTLEELNLTPADTVRRIAVNLERFRHFPRDMGNRYVLVNVAGYELVHVEEGLPDLTMRVIVGKGYRRTPVFSSKMTTIVFNPTWSVPTKIAVEDKLPMIRKDPDWLAKMGMTLYQREDGKRVEVDPATVDWSTLGKGKFPYEIIQDPGAKNALGRVKFLFPNHHAVYLHDTPERGLFRHAERAFSSGCIRLQKPVELAERILLADRAMASERVQETLAKPGEHGLTLKEKLPVYLLFWTAWVDEEGTLQLRRDLYGRDRRLGVALFGAPKPPPAKAPAATAAAASAPAPAR